MVSTWLQGLAGSWRWVPQSPARRARVAEAARLGEARQEFLAMLSDLRGGDTLQLRERIRSARSLVELWYLRTDVFRQVSIQRNQGEAADRLGWLNRYFPTRSPRSGFAGLGLPEVK